MKKSNSFANENTNSSLPQNKVLKQFGQKAFNRSHSTSDLVSKQSLKEDIVSVDDCNSSQKKTPITIPHKRLESAAGLENTVSPKKQNLGPLENTKRSRELVEWTLEMDSEPIEFEDEEFDKKAIVKESLPIKQPLFLQEDLERPDIEEDIYDGFSIGEVAPKEVAEKVEHGPSKEFELPYLPDDSWITDRRNFSGYADHVSYQYLELLNKGKLEFDSLADVDIVDPLCNNVFDHKELFYDTADEELEITDCEDFSSGGLGVPFNDYAFDVESFVQSL